MSPSPHGPAFVCPEVVHDPFGWWNQRLEGFTEAEVRDLREQFGDVWFQLATLLGHSSPEVTRDWYLEPFTGLQLDYLFSLLDDEEQHAVEVLLRAVAAGSDRVMSPLDGSDREVGGAW